jgi:hypothetical protein
LRLQPSDIGWVFRIPGHARRAELSEFCKFLGFESHSGGSSCVLTSDWRRVMHARWVGLASDQFITGSVRGRTSVPF